MRFDDFDRKMRVYEENLDQYILPDMFIVARLDGRSFTRLTKEKLDLERPFDIKFRDMMVKTAKYVMSCGFRIVYAYTESDEISLLFHPDDNTFGRKVRKLNTTLAGEASAVFSLEAGMPATFDCRIVPLPNIERVYDYFLWRQEDSHRNSLNAWCYWTLRGDGKTKNEATEVLSAKSVAFKNELLFSYGINYNDLPAWQRRGIGIWGKQTEKDGFNPITNESVTALRNELTAEYELPLGEDYRKLIKQILEEAAKK